MAEIGGQPGNRNATKNRIWSSAISRALEQRSRKDQVDSLNALAEKLLAKCDEGDMAALKELGDRLEGKPAQGIELGNANNEPFVVRIEGADVRL